MGKLWGDKMLRLWYKLNKLEWLTVVPFFFTPVDRLNLKFSTIALAYMLCAGG